MPLEAASLGDLLNTASANKSSRQLRTTAETRMFLPYQQIPNRRSYLCTRLQSSVRSRLQQQCRQSLRGTLSNVQAGSTGCRCQPGMRRQDGTTELRCWQVGTARCTYEARSSIERPSQARDPYKLPSTLPETPVGELPSSQPRSPQLPK